MALPDRNSAWDSSAPVTPAHDEPSSLDDLTFVELSETEAADDDWLTYANATRARIAAIVARYAPRRTPTGPRHPPVVIPPLGTTPPAAPRRLATGTRPGTGLFALDEVDLHELVLDELFLDDDFER